MIRLFYSRQFLAFLAVGTSAATLHWLARLILNIWLPFSWAVAMAYGVGLLVAFLLNSFYVFPLSNKPKPLQARDFIFVNLAFFPVVWLIATQINIWLQDSGFVQYSKEVAHAIAISVPMVATFLFYKFYAFREDHYG